MSGDTRAAWRKCNAQIGFDERDQLPLGGQLVAAIDVETMAANECRGLFRKFAIGAAQPPLLPQLIDINGGSRREAVFGAEHQAEFVGESISTHSFSRCLPSLLPPSEPQSLCYRPFFAHGLPYQSADTRRVGPAPDRDQIYFSPELGFNDRQCSYARMLDGICGHEGKS